MKFEIPFDEQIFRNQTTLKFKLAWKEGLKNNRRRLYYGIPSLILGVLILYKGNDIAYLFLGIGIHYLINFYEYYTYYSRNKKRYFNTIKAEIEEQKEVDETSIWEFNEDYFRFKYYKYDTKVKWKSFKRYRLIEDTLFLDLSYVGDSSFIASKSEIEIEDWDRILQFVKEKVKQDDTHVK